MKRNSLHRSMALLLAVCMTLTMNSGFAFAAEEPLPTAAETTETSREASVTDSGKEKLTDPMGSVTEGVAPSVNAPVCTCNPTLGTSSVEGHGADCPLYAPPEKPEQGKCTCPPVDSGEVVHGEGCPLYAAPVPTPAMNAVYALIDALPSLEELEAAFTLDSGTPPDMDKLQADAQAARTAYNALTDEEKANFDDLRLQKLEAIEGLFMVSLMAGTIPELSADANNSYQNVKYTLTTGTPNTATVSGVVDKTAVTGVDNMLTIPTQVQKDGTTYNVTAIGEKAFTGSINLTALTVPASVAKIDPKAFYNMKPGAVLTLEHQTLPEIGISYPAFETSKDNIFYIKASTAVAETIAPTCLRNLFYGIFVDKVPVEFDAINENLKMRRPLNYDENALVAKGGYDVLGVKGGQNITTTRNKGGYVTNISTAASPTYADSNLVRLPGKGAEVCAKVGIWAKVDGEFISDGKYLQVTYTLRNSTNSPINNVSLGVFADVQIGQDDKASVFPTPTGFRMVNQKTDVEDPKGSGMQFTLNCKNAPGVYDNVDTMWYGSYLDINSNLFTDLADKGDFTGKDSGLAFSWKNMTIPENSEITRSVVYGVAPATPPLVLPENPLKFLVSANLADLKVTAKVTDTVGLVDTLYYKVGNSADASFGFATATGSELEITGTIPQSALRDGDNSVSVWVMNDKGAMSESVTFTVTVTDGKIGTIDGSTPDVDYLPVTITAATPTHATTYSGTNGSIAITASGGQGTFEYSNDNSTWQTANTFTGLTAGAYTVYARDKADITNISAGTAVTVKQPAATPSITPSANPTLTYGDLVSVSVTATAPDSGTLTYQWYKGTSETDTDPSGKTPIGTATDYAQPSNASRLLAGAHYYFCVVTNTKGGATTSATSSVIAVTVQKKTPDFTFTADKNTAVHGETVKLSATIKAASGGSAPIGTVTFKDGDAVLDTVQVTRITEPPNIGHGGAVYNYAIPISHGTITATYTAAVGNYNSTAPASVTVSVSKKPLTVTVTAPTNLIYDGAAKAATLSGTTGLTESTDYTLTYTGGNTTTYNSTTAPTDVGDYTATFALTTEGAEIYDTGASTLSVSFAIAKAAGSGSVTCADIMFGGTAVPVPVSDANGITNVTYLYKVKNADDNTYSADTPTNVGDYTVKATFAATTNYEATTATVDFSITPAAVTGITVTPYNSEYDGEAHPIVTVTGAQSGDKVSYQLPSSSYTETLPTVTNVADSKSVMVKVTRANHVDFVSTWNAAKVTKKEVAVTFTVPADLIYNGDPKTVTAEITNKVVTDDVDVTLDNATGTAVGDYTTKASALTGAVAGNYKLPRPMPSVEWKIIGTPYPNEITLPTTTGITYGQKLSDSTLTGDNGGTGGFTWNDDTVMPPAGSYTATVVFTPNDNNFAPVTRTVKVAVAKADVTLEVRGTKVYHAAPISNADFAVSNISGMVNGETDTDLLGTLTFTSIGNTADVGVGSYDITIAQSGTSNYKVTTTAVTGKFTVTHAAQILSGTASYPKLLTDKDFALDVKTDSTDTDAVVTYTLTNDGSGSVTLGADGKTVHLHKTGTATITASATQTANFEAASDLTITVTVGSMPAVRVLAPEGITTTEAKISGTVTAGTVSMTGYGLEYKKSADADYTTVSPTETVNGNITMLTYSLVGLEKSAEYSVRVWAKTADKTFESVTHFRTAAEQPPTGKVEGEITDNSGENTAITVTIEEGNTIIASKTVTAGGGKFTFEALPDGFYNLVANNGKYKVTSMVEIVKGGAVTDVMMEIGKKQSVVEVKGEDTPKVAVDGLPELFENDTLYPQTDKDVISAGGTVEFKLTVQKTEASADAEEIGKIAEGKIGAYLDIQILKTVTDQNGREQESTLIPDLGANEITIVIPLAKELQGKASYTVYRVHGGSAEKLESAYNVASNTLMIKSSLFSTYAIAYTEKSGGDGGSGGGNSHDDDNYDFWQKVKDKINSAEDSEGLPLGYTVKAGAGSYDKMPESVMDALRKNPKVTLEITWNGGDKITIPAGGALKKDGLRIYYPLAYLAELYRDALPAELPSANKTNPETGGVWEVNAPATAVQAPAIITPKNEGTAATPEQAELKRAAIEPQTAPEIATIPDIAEAADGTPNRSKAMLFTGITIMLAAAAVACGVIIWKKKHKEEAFK